MHVYSSCARKMPLLKYYLVLLEHTFAIEPFHMQSDKENRAVALSLLPLPSSFSFFLWCPFLLLLLSLGVTERKETANGKEGYRGTFRFIKAMRSQ